MTKIGFAALVLAVLSGVPLVANAVAAPRKNEPIEISSDKLDVMQDEHKAIFTGNVIAVQGTSKMRSAEMIVFYRDSAPADTKPAKEAAANTQPQGIYRIEAQGEVVFTTPTETAIGDKGIYDVDKDTIDVLGNNVTLTRGANILKGTKLNYNMTTGRSILTGGATSAGEGAGKPARVHGLFLPNADKKPTGK